MKTSYAVEFIATPTQVNTLLADPVLSPLLLSAIANGTKPEWIESLGATSYCFQQGGADMVPETAIAALLDMGVIVLFSHSGVYVEVPTTVLDNLVPVGWADARLPSYTEPVEPVEPVNPVEPVEPVEIKGARRQYQEYTSTVAGLNGVSLLRCGYIPNGMRGFVGYSNSTWEPSSLDTVDTPAIISQYRTAFPTAELVFNKGFKEWMTNNT